MTTNNTMKERPILMSGPMVRALMSGAKTQTRRVLKNSLPSVEAVKLHCGEGYGIAAATWAGRPGDFLISGPVLSVRRLMAVDAKPPMFRCPYGQPGARLWVKETFAELIAVSPSSDQPLPITEGERLIEAPTSYTDTKGRTRWCYDGKVIAYRANSKIEFCDGDGFTGNSANKADMPKWRPSIHMPRWASRLTLEITSVRVERLNDISEEDAKAEGCAPEFEIDVATFMHNRKWDAESASTYKLGYKHLWESINGPGSWAQNPWVWAITFKVLRPDPKW